MIENTVPDTFISRTISILSINVKKYNYFNLSTQLDIKRTIL